jgi:hypothetical protein
MHIVSTTDKKIYFAPRATGVSVSVKITDEETNISRTFDTYASQSGNYSEIFLDEVVEGRYYTIRISSDGNEIYRGKVYCTNQTDLEKFSVNSGEFTYYEDTDNDNQYIYR